MSITNEAEWDAMREVGRVVRLTLDVLEDCAEPGITTSELDRRAAEVFRASGARSAPALVYNFPGTVLISVNDEVVHGVPGARRLKAGDVVKLDVTAEKKAPSVPNYFDARQTDLLTDGLVVAIEPIISSGGPRVVEDRDGWTIRTRDGSLAAHYEHTVVVTSSGPVLLTAA
jgi:methionine aminopeptidase